MKSLIALAALLTLAALPQANASTTLQSQKLDIKPSRVVNRAVLQQEDGVFTVQILEVSSGGSTDVSNTSRLILTVATLGEMFTNETSIVLTQSRGLISAKMVKPGFIELIHSDADAMESDGPFRNPENPMEVRRVIDARDAIKAVRFGHCPEFEECEFKTTVKIK